LALLAIVCCAGLPLLLATGLSAAAFAWIGGIALGAVVFAAAVALLLVRGRRASLRKDVQFR
jgi:orotate phosphoribosyltransferase